MIEEGGSAVLPPPEGENFASSSSGVAHACGLHEDGTPVCWLVIEGFFGGALEDTLAPPPEGETFTSISSGVAHTCGLRENGTPVCWLIVEEEGTSIQPPPEGETFVSISSGAYHNRVRAVSGGLCGSLGASFTRKSALAVACHS